MIGTQTILNGVKVRPTPAVRCSSAALRRKRPMLLYEHRLKSRKLTLTIASPTTTVTTANKLGNSGPNSTNEAHFVWVAEL